MAWRRVEYNCFQLPNGGFKRRWSQTLLGGVQSKDKGHIWQQGEVLLGTKGKRKKKVFTSRAVKHWKRLSRVVGFPSLEMLKA